MTFLDDGQRHLELAAEALVGVRPHALPPQPVVGHTQRVQPGTTYNGVYQIMMYCVLTSSIGMK